MRKTKKTNHGYEQIEICMISECSDKLGPLEDFEDDFGIELIDIIKALKNGVYVKKHDYIDFCKVGIDENTQLMTFSFDQINGIHFDQFLDPKDYGKTWSLSKEELW